MNHPVTKLALLSTLMLGLAGCLPAWAAVPPEWVPRWEEDLRFVLSELPSRHVELFHTITPQEWEAELEGLIGRVPAMEHHEIAVDLARIIARIGDGHTRLTLPLGPGISFMQGHSATPEPHLPELVFHQFPIRLWVDEGAVTVRAVAREHREILGGRVLTLGRLSTEEAIRAVSPTIRRDNEMQVLHHLPMHLVLAEVLHARKVIESLDRLPLTVEMPGGARQAATLPVVPRGRPVQWADLRDSAPAPAPLWQRHPEKNFWFTFLEETGTIYLQFNEVYDMEEESIREFASRLTRFMEGHPVEQVAVDLRRNRGGDQSLAKPLLHALICSDANRTGRLHALVGRTTFSAAMKFALWLEEHTHVLFAGEPTGASPNSYGDSRKVFLPHTNLTIRASTRYHQYDFTDVRPWLPPHIPVDLTVEDEAARRDPVLEAILDLARARRGPSAPAEGTWQGTTTPGLNWFEMAWTVAGDGSQPAVSVKVPALEISGARGEEVTFEKGILAFRLPWEEGTLSFRVEVHGDWIVGEGSLRERSFPLVLRRAAPRM